MKETNEWVLTSFLVEHDLEFEFRLVLERLFDGEFVLFESLGSVEKLASAALLHDLRPRVACEFAEPIAAVHDWVQGWHLSVAQHEVTVCELRKQERNRYSSVTVWELTKRKKTRIYCCVHAAVIASFNFS